MFIIRIRAVAPADVKLAAKSMVVTRGGSVES